MPSVRTPAAVWGIPIVNYDLMFRAGARDRLAINMLRSVGIEKGKPFAPTAATKETLTAALQEARAFFDQ